MGKKISDLFKFDPRYDELNDDDYLVIVQHNENYQNWQTNTIELADLATYIKDKIEEEASYEPDY